MCPTREFGLHDGPFHPPPGAIKRWRTQYEDLMERVTPQHEPRDQHAERTKMRQQQNDAFAATERGIEIDSSVNGGDQALNQRLIEALIEKPIDEMLIPGDQIASHKPIEFGRR